MNEELDVQAVANKLVDRLLDRIPDIRSIADAELGSSSPEIKAAVITELIAQSKLDLKNSTKETFSQMDILGLLALWGLMNDLRIPPLIQALTIIVAWLALMCYRLRQRETGVRKVTVKSRIRRLSELVTADTPVAFAPLTAGLVEWGIQPAIEQSLILLLPRIDGSVPSTVNEKVRMNLRLFLNIWNARTHSDLLLAIMDFCVRIGDVSAIPQIRELSISVVTSPGGFRVRQAARESVVKLEIIAEQRRQCEMLLRPSFDPAPNTTLLRPAGNAPTDDALLRPVEAPNAEQPLGGARGE